MVPSFILENCIRKISTKKLVIILLYHSSVWSVLLWTVTSLVLITTTDDFQISLSTLQHWWCLPAQYYGRTRSCVFYTVFKKRKKSEFFIVFPYGRRRHERSSELYAADSWLAWIIGTYGSFVLITGSGAFLYRASNCFRSAR